MPLVIVAHPNFERSIANRNIVEELQQLDPTIEVRNLHALYPDFNIDVAQEQAALLSHDTVVFQYPFYWYNMPAMLKHWFDSVFVHQFAYGSQGDKLKGKIFLPSITIGAFEAEYNALGKHHFRVHEFFKNLEQTAYYAQMKYVEPLYFHGSSGVSGNSAQVVKENARAHAHCLLQRIAELENDTAEIVAQGTKYTID